MPAFALPLLLLPLAAAIQSPPPSDSAVYQVAPASRLVVKTGTAGLFGFAGHSHVIRARAVSGELVHRPGTATSSLRLTVPADSLEVLTPPDTAEIRKVTEAMRSEVLHPDRHPEMTFAADSLSPRDGRMELTLAVTLEGVTREVPVTAEVTIGPDTITAAGSFTAKQTDFGIKPYSGGPLGTVKVADKVTFCFDLVAVRGPVLPGPTKDPTRVPGCVDTAREVPASERRPM